MTLVINDFNLSGTPLKVKSEIQFFLILWFIIENFSQYKIVFNLIFLFLFLFLFLKIWFFIFHHEFMRLVINFMSFQFKFCELFEKKLIFSSFFLITFSFYGLFFNRQLYSKNNWWIVLKVVLKVHYLECQRSRCYST
jgi:hypothetical protein